MFSQNKQIEMQILSEEKFQLPQFFPQKILHSKSYMQIFLIGIKLYSKKHV